MKRNARGWRVLRPLVAGVLSGVLLAAGLAAPAVADTPVTVDPDALASQLFAGVADARFDDGLKLVKAVTLSGEFLQWRRLHPAATLADNQDYLTGQKQLLDDGLTVADRQLNEPDLILRAIVVLSASGPASAARTAPHIRAMVEGIVGSSVGPLDSREDLSDGALANLSWQRSRDDILLSLWTDVRHSALADPVFGHAWNSVLGAPASLDATASLDQLKAADELASVDLDTILALSGSPDAFRAEANRQANSVVVALITVTQTATGDLALQVAKCPPKTPPGAECTPANEETAEQKDKERQAEIDKYKAALDALQPLIKTVDPSLAKQVKVVGDAIITTAKAISTYAKDISKIVEVGDKIFSLATLTMTGNIFGAVMTVVGLFGDDETPNLPKQTLDQVKAMRDQVKAMHTEMTAAFKRIDTRLNNIYDTMVAEFDKLNAAIQGNTAQLVQLQQNVAQLGLRLEEVTASILSAIGQAELINVRTSIDKYIGYAEHFGSPIPTFDPDYIGAETDMHLASTQLASDSAFVVSAADADNPALDPTAVLNSNGETRSINYLARLASRRDSAIASPTAPVGNAAVWNLGAQAYALLQLQNPGYAATVASSRANDIEFDGQRILDLAASFAHPVAAPDGAGNYRNALFMSLDSDYRTAVANLKAALQTIRTSDVQARFEPNADGVQIKTLKNYNLFWDGTAAPATDPPVPADPASITHCTKTQQITRPANVGFAHLPVQFKFLNYAYTPRTTEPPAGTQELPQVSICEVPSWHNTRTLVDNDSGAVDEYGQLRLHVFTRFRINPGAAWQNVVDTTYTWPDEVLYHFYCLPNTCRHGDITVAPETRLATVWSGTGQLDFQQYATSTVDPNLVSSAVTTIQHFLAIRQKFLYDSVNSALGNLSSPAAVSVAEMNTALRLLQAFTQLGLPIAVQSDDQLSALLFGQYKLLGNMPTEPTIAGAVQTAIGNYGCGTTCTFDASRPIENQDFFDPADPPCATSAAGPGDPLGNCLVEHALRRVTNLGARLEVHFTELFHGDYVEQLPSIARTLNELKVSDGMSHAAPATAGIGNRHNDQGQTVGLDLDAYTTGGKAPYTYTATNLPAGLTLGSGGVIGGTPTTNGTYSVTVTAHDASNVAGNAYTFRWTVGVVDVPDVAGLNPSQARAAIRAAGFPMGSATFHNDCTVPDGTVQSQTPVKDTEVSSATVTSTPVNIVYAACADSLPVLAPLTVSAGGVTLSWTDKSKLEDDFVVSRYTAAGQLVSEAADLPSDSRSGTGTVITFTDTAPSPSAPCYKVAAREFDGVESLDSALVCPPAPTVTDPGARTGYTGDADGLQIAATGQALTYAATGLPAGLTINGGTGYISGTPTTVGQSTVTVTVTNGSGMNASVTFSWSILSGTLVVTNPGSQTGAFGTPVNLQITAVDRPGRTLTYAASGLPDGLAINSGTGLISGTPARVNPDGTALPFAVTVNVTDSAGVGKDVSFVWTISAAQLLGNADFENGTAPWNSTPGVVTGATADEPAKSGSFLAMLNGQGTLGFNTLSQRVTLPAKATHYNLNFWLHIDTADTDAASATLQVQVINPMSRGTTLATYTNLDSNTGYALRTLDLSQFAGQTVTIKFTASEDAASKTNFVIDATGLDIY